MRSAPWERQTPKTWYEAVWRRDEQLATLRLRLATLNHEHAAELVSLARDANETVHERDESVAREMMLAQRLTDSRQVSANLRAELESAKTEAAAPLPTQPSPPPPPLPRASALRKREVAVREHEAALRECEAAVLAREGELGASELERAKDALESERARQAQMRATVAGRAEPMLGNAASVIAAAKERERETRMATERESARVAELEAELTTHRALLSDGKWSSSGASGQTEGEGQMPTPKRTREAHPSGEYKRKLATLRRYVVFFFRSKGWILEVALLATSSPVALKALYRAPRPHALLDDDATNNNE